MRCRSLYLVALLAIAPVPLCAQTAANASPRLVSAYGEKIQVNGIKNAGKINGSLYRGAQPHMPSFAHLKELGVTTIVDLRGEDAEARKREQKHAEELGLRFVSIPISGWSPPTNEQVAQFLLLFRGQPTEKVFVHCRFGDDRTGVMVATYRMAIEKWPADQALKEMYFFGFNGFWHPAMIQFVRDFPARLASAPALVSFGKANDVKATLPGVNSPN
jgi:tyrosine-protein phosphatase SIW14